MFYNNIIMKFFKNGFFPTLIYFLFYILITTSGIIGIFNLLQGVLATAQSVFYPNPYVISEISSSLLFGLPALGLGLISFMIIQTVRNTKVFFCLTFLITAFSHFLLSMATNVSLGDIRLVLVAILYIALLSVTLTIAWQRIIRQKNYKESLFFLPIMIVLILANLIPGDSFSTLYTSFAWKLNTIDYLFSKLNMDYIYFVIILFNISSCLLLLLLFQLKAFVRNQKEKYS
jgi:hypothetical protein